jgi:hypothetical protein
MFPIDAFRATLDKVVDTLAPLLVDVLAESDEIT